MSLQSRIDSLKDRHHALDARISDRGPPAPPRLLTRS